MLATLITDPDQFFSLIRKEAGIAQVTGQFVPGRTPYLHTLTLPHAGTVTFKFVNTIKHILDKAFKPIHGRDSHLSYLEITAQPLNQKAYFKAFYVKQVPIVSPFDQVKVNHEAQLTRLREIAAAYGIDLTDERAWDTTYREGFKNGGR